MPHLVDPLLVWLCAFVVLFAVGDFLLGKRGRRLIQDKLENLWIRLEDAKPRYFGAAEATLFCAIMDRLFSPRLFSLRRVGSCLMLYAFLIALFYGIVETCHYSADLPWQAPFFSLHFNTGFPTRLPSIMLATYATQKMAGLSTRIPANGRMSNLLFLSALLCSSFVSYVLTAVMLGPLSPIFIHNFFVSGIRQIMMLQPGGLYPIVVIDASALMHRVEFLSVLLFDWNRTSWELFLRELTIPTNFIIAFLSKSGNYPVVAEQASPDAVIFQLGPQVNARIDVPVMYELAYGYFVDLAFFSMRILIFCALLVSWIAVRPIHKLLSVIVLRFAESDKGPLTLMAVALAGLVKILQVLFASK